jgi:hypothetical protein
MDDVEALFDVTYGRRKAASLPPRAEVGDESWWSAWRKAAQAA